MPIVFAGSAREDYDINVATFSWVPDIDGSPERIAPEMDEGVYIPNEGGYVTSRWKSPVTNYWMSFYMNMAISGFGTRFSRLYLGKSSIWPIAADFPIYLRFSRGINNSANSVTLFVNNVNRGTHNYSIPSNSQSMRFDVRVQNDPVDGTISIYLEGVLVIQWTGDTSVGLANHDTMRMINDENTGAITYSQMIVTTSDVRIFRMRPMYITGNGAIQDWDGDYTDINESGLNNSTFIETNTEDAVSTYLWDKPLTPEGYLIAGIAINTSASVYGDVVNDIVPVYYDGVDTVELTPYSVDDLVLAGNRMIAEVDPVTGTRFTSEKLATLEFGFKAVGAA